MADIQNANPTVLSPAELPTRKTKKAPIRLGPESKYHRMVFDDPSNSDGDNEMTYEPIDEQEIYGMCVAIERAYSSVSYLYPPVSILTSLAIIIRLTFRRPHITYIGS